MAGSKVANFPNVAGVLFGYDEHTVRLWTPAYKLYSGKWSVVSIMRVYTDSGQYNGSIQGTSTSVSFCTALPR